VISGRVLLDYIVDFRELFPGRHPAPMAGFLRGFLDDRGRLLPGLWVVITAFFLSFLVYLILGFGKYLRWRIFRDVPSLVYVLCLFTLACWTLTGLSFFLDAYRVPVVLVLVGYLTVTAQFSSSDHYYHVFPARSGAPIATPVQVLAASHLDSVILVAANGGGIQSSAWTAKVLTELEREWRRSSPQNDTLFARSLRAISSVSGGSVGAMFFTAAYSNDGLPENDSKLKDVVRNAMTSSLDDVAWGLVYADLWRTLTPFLWKEFVDRGNALEQAFERLVPETAGGLSSWRSSVASGHRPANLFNATITETGGRLLISTSEFAKPHEACSQFCELYKGQDLAIASAARLSATFPFVTPATRADLGGPGTPQFHIVDGGYYDNYGMSTLAEWLREALSSGETHVRRMLVLQIRGFPPDPPERPDTKRGWFYQLYTPIGTMLHARSCAQLAHNDIEFDLMQQVCADHGLDLETAIFQFKAKELMDSPPLSWHLTNRQKQAIEQGWSIVETADIEKVRAFLKAAKPVKDLGSAVPPETIPV
jgi:Patatin-like phospholipase